MERTSPVNPTSPQKIISFSIHLSIVLEAIAAIIDKSAAGSSIFNPPTRLTKISFVPIASPIRFSNTAMSIPRRL